MILVFSLELHEFIMKLLNELILKRVKARDLMSSLLHSSKHSFQNMTEIYYKITCYFLDFTDKCYMAAVNKDTKTMH